MQPFMRRPKRMLLGVALAALCLASAGVGRADSPVYQGMLRSTGLVEVPHPKGSVTYGTCWVVDRQRGLALTSQHVVGDAAEAVVYFPAYRDGAAIPELAHYHRQVAAVHGRVVHRDVRRDLALLRLDALPDHVQAIPLAAQSADPGDTVHSIGNSGVRRGRCGATPPGRCAGVPCPGPPGGRAAEGPHHRDPVAHQRGDSGGPLVNDRGELVGVVSEHGETNPPGEFQRGRHRGYAALFTRSRAGSAWGGEVGPKQLWHRVPSFVTVGWVHYSISPPLRNPRLLA